MAKTKEESVTTTFPKIYIGPSIPKGYFKTNMIFANGYPAPAQELINKYPVFEKLIVPTSEYTSALQQLGKKGTLLNNYAREATSLLKEGING